MTVLYPCRRKNKTAFHLSLIPSPDSTIWIGEQAKLKLAQFEIKVWKTIKIAPSS